MCDVEIKLLTENNKVIPLVYQMKEFWTTNVKLPNIIVTNNETTILELMSLEVVGMCEDREVMNLKVHKEDISTFVKEIVTDVNSMFTDGKQTWFDASYGKFNITDEKLTDKIKLHSNESTIIPLSKMLFLDYTGTKIIDSIQLNLFVNGESGEQSISYEIKLEQYKNKNNYIFPIKDKVCLANLPISITRHRSALSQEFAFDVIGQSDVKSIISEPQPNHVSEYYINQKNVLAIGDGVVVDVGDKFPDSPMNNTHDFTDEYRTKLFTKLGPEIGIVNTLAGNYVVIDHGNDEFSFYAHLSENTICVKKGDKVKQGTIIGKVGNTGNSTAPHLHFHLMDSPNMLEANGLPIMFQDINLNSLTFNLTETNTIVFSDFVYIDNE